MHSKIFKVHPETDALALAYLQRVGQEERPPRSSHGRRPSLAVSEQEGDPLDVLRRMRRTGKTRELNFRGWKRH